MDILKQSGTCQSAGGKQDVSLKTAHTLVATYILAGLSLTFTSIISYFTTIIIFNDVFFLFRPPFVSSPVSNVTSIGNMMAN